MKLIKAALLLSICTLYLTKIGISPLYVITPFLLLLTLFWFFDIDYKKYRHIEINSAVATICIVSTIIIFNTLDSRPQDIYNFAVSPCLFFISCYICRKFSAKETASVTIKWIAILLLVFTLEACLRFLLPENEYLNGSRLSESDSNDMLYRFKFASFMFEDSNYVGLELLLIFGTILGLRELYTLPRKFYFLELWCSILIVMSFSRASIISLVFVYALYYFRNFGSVSRYSISLLGILCGFFIYDLIKDDGSFNSKFGIIQDAENYLNNASFSDLWFGSGIGRSIDTIGIGAHNIFVLYTVEAGLLYFIMFALMAYLCAKTKYLRYIILGFMINGFSLTTYAVPYLFASLGLLSSVNLKTMLEKVNRHD